MEVFQQLVYEGWYSTFPYVYICITLTRPKNKKSRAKSLQELIVSFVFTYDQKWVSSTSYSVHLSCMYLQNVISPNINTKK